ncbi:MAG: TraC family protein [Rickettsiaceae bacterium]|nr:TraC family protein [Rickettsiaceae bacterium]
MFAFERQIKNFAEYFGFKSIAEKGVDSKEEFRKLLDKSTNGATPLSFLLPYQYFDDENGLVFNDDGTCGFWFEIYPIVGSNLNIEKNLTLFFNDELPEGSYLQFLIVASHDISVPLSIWEKERLYGGSSLDKLTKYRKWFIEKAAIDFAASGDGRLARNYRVFVTYSSYVTQNKNSIDAVIKFKSKLANKLRAEKLYQRECGANDLISIGKEILQMELSTEKTRSAKYNVLDNLSDQICSPMTSVIFEEDKITHETTGLVSKIFYPKELPESFSLAEMIKLLGSGDKAIPARFILSYALASNLGSGGSSSLVSQGLRSIHAAEKSYTRNDLNAQEEASQWRKILSIHKKGERFLTENLAMMITAPEKDIDNAEETLKSLWNAEDWKLQVNKHLQMLGLFSMLPMLQSSYWKSLSWYKLTRYVLSGEVVAKLPIQGEWKGVPKSGVLMIGRRGQVFNFNPYFRIGGGGNYNICMMAPSGSGKSFFLQELATSMLAQDVAVFVLDIGASYQNICHLLGGELIRFNKDNNISLNPFATLSNSGARYAKALEMLRSDFNFDSISQKTGLSVEMIKDLDLTSNKGAAAAKNVDGIEVLEIEGVDEDGIQKIHFVTKDSIIYAKAMLSTMCGVSGDIRGEAIIERAISEGIACFGENLDITKLCEILSNLRDRNAVLLEGASKLSDSLYPYTENGIHGRYFKAGPAASFKEIFTIFEFEEIKNDKPLLAVVLQVILMQITMQFLCGDRTRKFMLIVDEAWMILDYAAHFLESFSRTVRKYGGSLVICTQDLSSFNKSPSHSAILESSTWKLMMMQSETGLETFVAREEYKNFIGLISSLRKCERNKFSEVLFDTNGAKVVGRLAVDPYSTALYSTEHDDYAYLKDAEQKGVSKGEAILTLAKKYGELPSLVDGEL